MTKNITKKWEKQLAFDLMNKLFDLIPQNSSDEIKDIFDLWKNRFNINKQTQARTLNDMLEARNEHQTK